MPQRYGMGTVHCESSRSPPLPRSHLCHHSMRSFVVCASSDAADCAQACGSKVGVHFPVCLFPRLLTENPVSAWANVGPRLWRSCAFARMA